MTTIEQVNEWLARLGGTDDGEPSLALDEAGVCGIADEHGHPHYIELPADQEVAVLHTTVARAEPEAGTLSLLSRALHLNLFGLETRGGHIGLDSEISALVFSQQWPVATLDAELFQQAFEIFVELAANIRTLLQPLEDAGNLQPEADMEEMLRV